MAKLTRISSAIGTIQGDVSGRAGSSGATLTTAQSGPASHSPSLGELVLGALAKLART